MSRQIIHVDAHTVREPDDEATKYAPQTAHLAFDTESGVVYAGVDLDSLLNPPDLDVPEFVNENDNETQVGG